MTVTLPDGSAIDIRPIKPEDRDALVAGFERLSPKSRYRRFFGPVSRLSDRDLDYLTCVDHHDHEALVAIDEDTEDGLGVARFVRIAAGVAEPAVAVVDDWQGRGVGRALLDALVTRALAEGIRRFDAPVLATNHEAMRVFARIGETTVRHDGREVMLMIELPVEPPIGPGLGDLLGQFAGEAVQPVRTLVQRLWPHRRGEPDDERRNVIVVGTNGSRHAEAAVDAAAALAAVSEASLDVVGVHPFLTARQSELQRTVREASARLRERGLQVRDHVRRGDPALVITDVAGEQNARLIVVGAGERGQIARRIVGDVADLVAQWSPCSVLIVRPRAGEGGGEVR